MNLRTTKRRWGDVLRTYRARHFLNLPPLRTRVDGGELSIHTLFCKRNVYMVIPSIQSFLYFSKLRDCVLHLHGDRSVGDAEKEMVLESFPDCQVHLVGEADDKVEDELRQYPKLTSFRRRFTLMQKIVDPFLYRSSEKMLYIDADILFFAEPKELLSACMKDGCYYNRDLASSYIITEEECRSILHLDLIENLNAGLWCASSDIIDFDLMEQFLAHPQFEEFYARRPHVTEQTLFAILASGYRHPTGPLPCSYDVSLTKSVADVPCKHYVGAIRNQYLSEGLAYLRKCKFPSMYRQFATDQVN